MPAPAPLMMAVFSTKTPVGHAWLGGCSVVALEVSTKHGVVHDLCVYGGFVFDLQNSTQSCSSAESNVGTRLQNLSPLHSMASHLIKSGPIWGALRLRWGHTSRHLPEGSSRRHPVAEEYQRETLPGSVDSIDLAVRPSSIAVGIGTAFMAGVGRSHLRTRRKDTIFIMSPSHDSRVVQSKD